MTWRPTIMPPFRDNHTPARVAAQLSDIPALFLVNMDACEYYKSVPEELLSHGLAEGTRRGYQLTYAGAQVQHFLSCNKAAFHILDPGSDRKLCTAVQNVEGVWHPVLSTGILAVLQFAATGHRPRCISWCRWALAWVMYRDLLVTSKVSV